MKKLICTLMLMFSFASVANAADFINGIDKDYPPFAFINVEGKATGFDVDSMNWIAKKMGFTVEHKPFEWKSIVQMLAQDKIQMVASGMSITPERAEQVNFSNPYWTVKKVFIVKKDSDLTKDKILNSKLRVGVQQGTDEVNVLKKMVADKEADFQIVQYASSSDIISEIMNGRLQAGAMDSAPAQNAINLNIAVKEVGSFGSVVDFGVAVNKKNGDLLNKINEGYKLLMADPYWAELKKKYKLD